MKDEPSTSTGAAQQAQTWMGLTVSPKVKGLILLNILTFLYGRCVAARAPLAQGSFSSRDV